MLKIAIVDDSKDWVFLIKMNIEKNLKKDFECVCYTNPQMLKLDIEEMRIYDIYFLDIEMPYINGFDLAKFIRSQQADAQIVFLTSHSEYALQSYDVKIQAFYYLMKDSMQQRMPEILNALVEKNRSKKYYIIQNQVRFTKIDCEEIYYVYKEVKNSVIVTASGIYKERKTLEKIMEDLNMSELIMIDRGIFVNILYIKEIRNDMICMDNGEKLYISRKNIKQVKQEVNEYWGKQLK